MIVAAWLVMRIRAVMRFFFVFRERAKRNLGYVNRTIRIYSALCATHPLARHNRPVMRASDKMSRTQSGLRVTAAPLMQSPREETNKKRGLHCGCYHATARRAM
jgi:hypothetical protein